MNLYNQTALVVRQMTKKVIPLCNSMLCSFLTLFSAGVSGSKVALSFFSYVHKPFRAHSLVGKPIRTDDIQAAV